MSVGIYNLDRGISKWVWLCQKHLRARKAEGWAVKGNGTLPVHELTCDDCTAEVIGSTVKAAEAIS